MKVVTRATERDVDSVYIVVLVTLGVALAALAKLELELEGPNVDPTTSTPAAAVVVLTAIVVGNDVSAIVETAKELAGTGPTEVDDTAAPPLLLVPSFLLLATNVVALTTTLDVGSLPAVVSATGVVGLPELGGFVDTYIDPVNDSVVAAVLLELAGPDGDPTTTTPAPVVVVLAAIVVGNDVSAVVETPNEFDGTAPTEVNDTATRLLLLVSSFLLLETSVVALATKLDVDSLPAVVSATGVVGLAELGKLVDTYVDPVNDSVVAAALLELAGPDGDPTTTTPAPVVVVLAAIVVGNDVSAVVETPNEFDGTAPTEVNDKVDDAGPTEVDDTAAPLVSSFLLLATSIVALATKLDVDSLPTVVAATGVVGLAELGKLVDTYVDPVNDSVVAAALLELAGPDGDPTTTTPAPVVVVLAAIVVGNGVSAVVETPNEFDGTAPTEVNDKVDAAGPTEVDDTVALLLLLVSSFLLLVASVVALATKLDVDSLPAVVFATGVVGLDELGKLVELAGPDGDPTTTTTAPVVVVLAAIVVGNDVSAVVETSNEFDGTAPTEVNDKVDDAGPTEVDDTAALLLLLASSFLLLATSIVALTTTLDVDSLPTVVSAEGVVRLAELIKLVDTYVIPVNDSVVSAVLLELAGPDGDPTTTTPAAVVVVLAAIAVETDAFALVEKPKELAGTGATEVDDTATPPLLLVSSFLLLATNVVALATKLDVDSLPAVVSATGVVGLAELGKLVDTYVDAVKDSVVAAVLLELAGPDGDPTTTTPAAVVVVLAAIAVETDAFALVEKPKELAGTGATEVDDTATPPLLLVSSFLLLATNVVALATKLDVDSLPAVVSATGVVGLAELGKLVDTYVDAVKDSVVAAVLLELAGPDGDPTTTTPAAVVVVLAAIAVETDAFALVEKPKELAGTGATAVDDTATPPLLLVSSFLLLATNVVALATKLDVDSLPAVVFAIGVVSLAELGELVDTYVDAVKYSVVAAVLLELAGPDGDPTTTTPAAVVVVLAAIAVGNDVSVLVETPNEFDGKEPTEVDETVAMLLVVLLLLSPLLVNAAVLTALLASPIVMLNECTVPPPVPGRLAGQCVVSDNKPAALFKFAGPVEESTTALVANSVAPILELDTPPKVAAMVTVVFALIIVGTDAEAYSVSFR